MDTHVLTPQKVFMQPQRLVVPLFQRPYVWSQDEQWEPLWSDVVRVADRMLKGAPAARVSHFLGAVVLQQSQGPIGLMQQWTIIDGQQRLTTLQLLLDALHSELVAAKAVTPALRLEQLVRNPEPYCTKPEDRFKVWPTNRDRPAFNAVMGAPAPVDYMAVAHPNERMVQAHRFFSEQARLWLTAEGPSGVEARSQTMETALREALQMVVIDLGPDENAQAIFETLNARGTPLTAADLIKNFVFQRLAEANSNVEEAYESGWQEFETGFWEAEVGVGRIRHPRSSVFLNHWLVARTGEVIVAREVFARFKRFADDDGRPMAILVGEIQRAAKVYRAFVESAEVTSGVIDRLGLFGYRTGVLESEVIKPLVLWLLDPREVSIPAPQVTKALESIESWMVRRMLVRATTKNYNQVFAELVSRLRTSGRAFAGETIGRFLADQDGASTYWPDDQEVEAELRDLQAYRRLSRGRLRMVLEAIEDHLRGWKAGASGLGGERVDRGSRAIEHVLPRKWQAHWPLSAAPAAEGDRERLIHTLGNLTLLTGKLNSKVSNGPWTGKRAALEEHDALFLNRVLLKAATHEWTEQIVRDRTAALARVICEIWPVPEGHKSSFAHEKPRPRQGIEVSDLLNAGLLSPGQRLIPRRKKFAERVVTLLPDGRLDVGGVAFDRPSGAAVAITGKPSNGWWFFLIDGEGRRSLGDVRRTYVAGLAVDVEDDDADVDGDDEDGE